MFDLGRTKFVGIVLSIVVMGLVDGVRLKLGGKGGATKNAKKQKKRKEDQDAKNNGVSIVSVVSDTNQSTSLLSLSAYRSLLAGWSEMNEELLNAVQLQHSELSAELDALRAANIADATEDGTTKVVDHERMMTAIFGDDAQRRIDANSEMINSHIQYCRQTVELAQRKLRCSGELPPVEVQILFLRLYIHLPSERPSEQFVGRQFFWDIARSHWRYSGEDEADAEHLHTLMQNTWQSQIEVLDKMMNRLNRISDAMGQQPGGSRSDRETFLRSDDEWQRLKKNLAELMQREENLVQLNAGEESETSEPMPVGGSSSILAERDTGEDLLSLDAIVQRTSLGKTLLPLGMIASKHDRKAKKKRESKKAVNAPARGEQLGSGADEEFIMCDESDGHGEPRKELLVAHTDGIVSLAEDPLERLRTVKKVRGRRSRYLGDDEQSLSDAEESVEQWEASPKTWPKTPSTPGGEGEDKDTSQEVYLPPLSINIPGASSSSSAGVPVVVLGSGFPCYLYPIQGFCVPPPHSCVEDDNNGGEIAAASSSTDPYRTS